MIAYLAESSEELSDPTDGVAGLSGLSDEPGSRPPGVDAAGGSGRGRSEGR